MPLVRAAVAVGRDPILPIPTRIVSVLGITKESGAKTPSTSEQVASENPNVF